MSDYERITDVSSRYVLGIDESNHGHFPEIVVGVWSNDLSSANPGRLGKIRCNERGLSIPDILKNKGCAYLRINESDVQKVGNLHNAKLVAYAELIKAACQRILKEHSFGILESIIIDEESKGWLSEKDTCILRTIVSPFEIRNNQVIMAQGADEAYPIVNIADNIANLLFRKTKSNGKPEESDDYKVEVRFENYARLFVISGIKGKKHKVICVKKPAFLRRAIRR